MGDWPSRDIWGLDYTISPSHPLSLGVAASKVGAVSGVTSTAWPAANRAILIPFRLPKLVTVYKATVGCGSTGGGNFDVGVYDDAGNRIVSSGATSRAAAAEVNVDLTDTVLGPGRYYMALSCDGTNNFRAATTGTNVFIQKMVGVRQASSAYVLPATVTFETMATAFIPWFVLRLRSY